MNSNILVFGAGWIGTRIADHLKCNVSAKNLQTYEDIQSEIEKYSPKVIINCLELEGKMLEDQELNKTETVRVYTMLPLLLAEAAIRNGLKLVHISTGNLFDLVGDKQATENDAPNFFSLFNVRAKIYTEAAFYALKDSVNLLQLRIRLPIDYMPHPQNLMNKLISFKSVIENPQSVTYLPDFLDALEHLLKIDAEGLYNVTNYGSITYRKILEEFRKYFPTHLYAITSLNELKLVRTNVLLATDKLEESGYKVRDIEEAIPECVEKYVAILKAQNARSN